MLLQHDYRYVNFDAPDALAIEIRDEILAGKVVASFSDGSRLYTHAGLRSAVRSSVDNEIGGTTVAGHATGANLKRLSDRLNSILISSLQENDLGEPSDFSRGRERGGRHAVGGIFWCDYSLISASEHAYDVPQIFGHTPTRKRSVKHCRSLKLIDVDTGMCRVYGGNRVYLEIGRQGTLTQHSKEDTGWKKEVLM